MILIYMLVFGLPLVQHPLWQRFVGDLTMIKYVGAACVLYAFAYLLFRRSRPRYLELPQARWFLLLCVLAALSFATRGANIPWHLSPVLSYASFVLLGWMVLVCVDSTKRLRNLMLVSVASVAFASLYVIREWQKSLGIWEQFRPGWVTGDANYYALNVVLVLPIAFVLATEPGKPWIRLFNAACLAVILPGLFLSGSRGGFLGVVVGLLVIIWRSRYRVQKFLILALLLVPLAVLVPGSPISRLFDPNRIDRENAASRIYLWQSGLRMALDHPWLGVGLGNFKPLVTQYQDPDKPDLHIAHNTYIGLFAELGIVGLLAFLFLLAYSFRTIRRARRFAREQHNRIVLYLLLGLEAGLAGYCVSAFFLSAQYVKFFWLLVFLVMTLPQLQRSTAVRTALEEVTDGSGHPFAPTQAACLSNQN